MSLRRALVVCAVAGVSLAFSAPTTQPRARTYALLDGSGRQFTDTPAGEGIEVDIDIPSRAISRRWSGRRWPEMCDALPLYPDAITLTPIGRAGRAVEWSRIKEESPTRPGKRILGDVNGTFAYPVRRPRPLYVGATWTEETNLAMYTFDVASRRVDRIRDQDYRVWRVSGLVESKREPYDKYRLELLMSEEHGTLRIASLSNEPSPCDVVLVSEPR